VSICPRLLELENKISNHEFWSKTFPLSAQPCSTSDLNRRISFVRDVCFFLFQPNWRIKDVFLIQYSLRRTKVHSMISDLVCHPPMKDVLYTPNINTCEMYSQSLVIILVWSNVYDRYTREMNNTHPYLRNRAFSITYVSIGETFLKPVFTTTFMYVSAV
jgi:hypothetical protein